MKKMNSQMRTFKQAMQQKLAIFSPFLSYNIEISSDLFLVSKGTVADFVAEIEQTCQLLSQQTDAVYAAFHSQRLVQQFDCLKNAVDRLAHRNVAKMPSYRSPYRFAKNPQKLPPCKRRLEYQKALRALNEKLSWLIEQRYSSQNLEHQALFHAQIQETEYRKQKCLAALAELE